MRELINEIGELERKIWDSKNKEANNDWEEIADDLLYENDSEDFEEFGDEDDERNGTERYWDDLEDYQIEFGIQEANRIINKYKLI